MTGNYGLRRREFLRLSGLLGLGLSAGLGRSIAATTSEPLQIVTLTGSFNPVIDELLKDGKYYEQFGLNATTVKVADGTKVLAALLSGTADLSTGSGFPGVFPAIEHGAKVKIVAGVTLGPSTAIFSARPDIKSAKDLVGKTVATGPLGAQLHQLAVALLNRKGIDYTKVDFVNIGSIADVFKAVVAGKVDAGFGAVDVYYEQEKYGVHALTDGLLWKELPDFTNQAMVASDSAIAGKRDQIVKALALHAKLFRYINTPDSKQAWIKARAVALSVDSPKEAEAQWTFFNAPGMLGTDLVLTPPQIDFVQNLNAQLGQQQKVLPFDQVADMSLARDALKLLG